MIKKGSAESYEARRVLPTESGKVDEQNARGSME
jgi:hypothetical protein